MVLFWVDNCIFYSNNNQYIEDTLTSLNDEFIFEKKEDMAGFWGTQIERDKQDGKLTLTQTGLIDMIPSSTYLKDSNVKFTPADKIPLNNDLEGENCYESWNY